MDITKTVGNTPLIKIGKIYAKLETVNPTGSIKDRMAWYMVKKAEERGELKKGATIIECTSGNTGIAFSMISATKGYKFIAVMPECMSVERQKMMKTFGAQVILSPAREHMSGAMRVYKEVCKKYRSAWLPRQFENTDNIKAHQEGTAQEIIKQMKGKIDAFVAGVGTGGTLVGIARALKAAGIPARIVAVEPSESAVLSNGSPGYHDIQGIGEGFIPGIVRQNMSLIDEVICIGSKEAIRMSQELACKHGLLVGISSGANVLAAMGLSDRYRNVVTILPDRGERYLSDICTT